MKNRNELYNIHVDVLFRLREPGCMNKMDSGDLNTIQCMVSDLILSHGRDKINHPFLANARQGMLTAVQIRHRMKLRGTRMFLMGTRGGVVCGSVRELGLDEDSVMADAAWAAERVVGLLGNSRMKINFIVKAEILVERPDGVIERLPDIVLCDRIEEKEK